jgi:hypothetical protein
MVQTIRVAVPVVHGRPRCAHRFEAFSTSSHGASSFTGEHRSNNGYSSSRIRR